MSVKREESRLKKIEEMDEVINAKRERKKKLMSEVRHRMKEFVQALNKEQESTSKN